MKIKFLHIIFLILILACSSDDLNTVNFDEEDLIYVGVSSDTGNNTLHELDLNSGAIGEPVYTAAGFDQVGAIVFSKESDTFMNGYSVLCGQGGGCSSGIVIKNRDNNLGSEFSYCTDLWCNQGYRIKSFNNGKFIYEYYNDDFVSGKLAEHLLISIDLYTMEPTILRDYSVEGVSNIERGLYIESSNEIIGYTGNGVFVRFNLNDFSRNEYSYPEIRLKSFIEISSEKIYAIQNDNSIVEVNPTNGEILTTIYSGSGFMKSITYSESSGRFYWVGTATQIHIYHPDTTTKTILNTENSLLSVFTDN